MSAQEQTHREAGAQLVALLLAVAIGLGAAFGVAYGLVSLGSSSAQVTKPLVSYNTR